MDLKEVFYLIASITLGILSIALISLFVLLFRLKKRIDEGIVKFNELTRLWGRITVTRFLLRIFKLIF